MISSTVSTKTGDISGLGIPAMALISSVENQSKEKNRQRGFEEKEKERKMQFLIAGKTQQK